MKKITQERLQEIRNAFRVLGSISDEELKIFSKYIACNNASEQVVEKITKHEEATYERVTEIIQKLGISPNFKGYKYLREAIIIYMEDKDSIHIIITKELYPAIAKKFETTDLRVERAIRHAIEIAWSKKCNEDLRKQIFGDVTNFKKSKPTNSELIAYVAEYLKMH